MHQQTDTVFSKPPKGGNDRERLEENRALTHPLTRSMLPLFSGSGLTGSTESTARFL